MFDAELARQFPSKIPTYLFICAEAVESLHIEYSFVRDSMETLRIFCFFAFRLCVETLPCRFFPKAVFMRWLGCHIMS